MNGKASGDLDGFLKMIDLWREYYEVDDYFYRKVLDACSKITKWDEKNAYKYLIRFLELWGMGRPASKIDPGELAAKLNECTRLLEQLEGEDLLTLDLKARRNLLAELFGKISAVKHVGPTGASKILHLLKPNVFVMWDQEIRRQYGVSDNEEGYLEFLAEMKSLLKELLDEYGRRYDAENPVATLVGKYRKPLTKLIDEYNWLTARKQPYRF